MSAERESALSTLADVICDRADNQSSKYLRVALTGITACGKSTMGGELTAILSSRGRSCVNISVDDFHMPRAHRHRRGRESAEGYYYDAFNYSLLKELVLEPLGPQGDGLYRERGFDLALDESIIAEPVQARAGDIFLFSASFLFRPEIVNYFDYKIFIDTDFDVAEQRGVARDAVSLESSEKAAYLYHVRYHAAQRLYIQEANPKRSADVIVNNNDIDHPELVFK